ncbi:hypothetical protein GOBAR_AA02147 [Gossypium barbadense]|uniref:Uncharacterized protein n=1 Tax=Gossypium barbadense TaxID=3634 RepID=A0A2P5YS96_GOSBA|nr:hypothetical protein GOBAR_AA02147 [Gossypium barbadense]
MILGHQQHLAQEAVMATEHETEIGTALLGPQLGTVTAFAAQQICLSAGAVEQLSACPYPYHFVPSPPNDSSRLVPQPLLDVVGLRHKGAPKQQPHSLCSLAIHFQ